MPIGIVGAIIGAGALAAGGTIAASSIASHAASNAAAQNNALQTSIYNQNSANAKPYIQAGDNALNTLQGFLGVGGDPQAASKALNDYLGSTGYQFNLDQGLNAVESSKAAQGLLGSGSTLEALDKFGTGLADSYGQQYEGNLQNLANTGQSAEGSLAGTGQSYANAVSSNNNSAAANTGNAFLAGSSSLNGLIGNALTANAFANGGSSFGGGAGGAGATGNLSSLIPGG